MDNRLPISLSRHKLIAAGFHSFAAIFPVRILHSLLTGPGGYPLAYAIHGGVAAWRP